MRKVLFIIAVLISMVSLNSCWTTKGELLLPPKVVDVVVSQGTVQFGMEITLSQRVNNSKSYKNYYEDPGALFGDNVNVKQEMTRKAVVSQGDTYTFIVNQEEAVTLYVQSVMTDSVIQYTYKGQTYSVELPQNMLFPKFIRFEY